jgi:hypothetical protein
MLTKQNLQVLCLCVEAAQKAGQIDVAAMMPVGQAYANAKALIAGMPDGSAIEIPKKNEQPAASAESSPNEAELKPVPKKAK